MSQVEDLNYDFNYNLFIAKTLVGNLQKQEDKNRSIRWMKKLSTCNRTINEMSLRNDFMYYLIVNMQNGELQPPFNENPPQKPLPSIAHFLVTILLFWRRSSADLLFQPGGAEGKTTENKQFEDAQGSAPKKPFIYAHSPDGGEFLTAQPIPRCGAFCYLAVVARKPEHD